MDKLERSYNVFKDVFPYTSSSGDLMELTDEEAVLENIYNYLSTDRGTYPFDPTYGTNLSMYIYELNSETVKFEIDSEIRSVINRYSNSFDVKHTLVWLKEISGYQIDIIIKRQDGSALKKTMIVSDKKI